MARILVTSSRHPGLVYPLLQIVKALTTRGDTVFVLTGCAFERAINDAGATFLQLPYDIDAPLPQMPVRDRQGIRALGQSLRELLLDPIAQDHATVLKLCTELRIDIIVTEPLFVGAEIVGLLPRDRRPAVLTVGLFPLPLASHDTAPYGSGLAPIDGPLNAIRNVALNVLTDHILIGGVRRAFAIEAHRLTGVRPRGGIFDQTLAADVYAQMTVQQFEYPRRSLSPKVQFVGPLPPLPLGTLPDWWDYSDRRPIVYVTQGTYTNDDPTELIVPTIRALADDPVVVVATTGGPDPATIEAAYGGPLPANARVATFLPYTHLLSAASVVVTQGGYGSTQHALRWGVPLVVSGTSEDKSEVNARVEWSGVGVNLRAQRPTPYAIRSGVLKVLGDRSYQRASVRIGAAIAATSAAASILKLVDELIADRTVPAAAPPKRRRRSDATH